MTGNYLITTDNWFIAPNGKSYRSVYGNVEIVSDQILGIQTNSRSSNWYAKVGSEDNHVIIAGCQIHYAVKCNKPNLDDVEDYTTEGGYKKFQRPSQVYDAS